MKIYEKWARSKIRTIYVEFDAVDKWLAAAPKNCCLFDPIDHELDKKYKMPKLESPMFIATKTQILEEFDILTHASFYKWQRKRLNILMKNGKPVGGKWFFDTENRENLPKKIKIPDNPHSIDLPEARSYIKKKFGKTGGKIIFPVSRQGAISWLKRFVEQRFSKFGKYEDASRDDSILVFHSGLSPMLNIGLITDEDVLKEVIAAAVPIASKEGFLRQLLGWRNYMYAQYVINGKKLPKMNFFNHRQRFRKKWWVSFGIEPIDILIAKIKEYGYIHHIERLMHLGAFLFMMRIDPRDVYRLFMEWTIDAYEWVMVPNIYGMSQFADGGIVMKRPYFSSSAYLLKMSNLKKGPWCEIWDAAFWNFIKDNGEFFKKTYFARLVKMYIQMPASKKKSLDRIFHHFMETRVEPSSRPG